MPDDARQALRIRRYFIGSGTSLLVPVCLFLAHWLDVMPMSAALAAQAMVVLFSFLRDPLMDLPPRCSSSSA